jgi:hypothetical protein
MIALDDPTWANLLHAHGPAIDTPKLLGRVASGDFSTEVSEALWGSLCEEGKVFTASYAALPHLVAALGKYEPGERLDLLVLITVIARTADADVKSPLVPQPMRPAFDRALEEAKPYARDLLFAQHFQPEDVPYVLGVAAVLMGHTRAGLDLMELDAGMECPSCGEDIDLMNYFGLTTT